jgi:hypothetical protein
VGEKTETVEIAWKAARQDEAKSNRMSYFMTMGCYRLLKPLSRAMQLPIWTLEK